MLAWREREEWLSDFKQTPAGYSAGKQQTNKGWKENFQVAQTTHSTNSIVCIDIFI